MRALLVALALLAAWPAAAQNRPQPPPLPNAQGARAMTLAEAERLLMERNLAVVAAQRGVDAARAQRLIASSRPPPTVSVGNTFGEFREVQGSGPQAPRGRFFDNNVNVGLSVLIELGGKRELRTRLAEEGIGVAEAQVLDALRMQLFQLRQSFIAALAARANFEVALANRASLDRTEALLRRRLQDGALPEGDLLRFQASRLPFEADVTGAATAYAAAVAQVAAILAFDAANVTPAARASGLPPVALDVRGRIDTRAELGVPREVLAEAVQSRADVVAALRLSQAAGVNTNLAEAGRWRDVTLNGGWDRSRLSQDQPESTRPLIAHNQFTFSLSVPIFTDRIVRGGIGVAQAQQAQAAAQAQAALLQARADFAAAWTNYEQSRALLRLYTGAALTRAEQAYRSTEQAFLAGGRDLLDVLDALRTLNATRLAANNARAAYLNSLTTLEAATGVSGISPRL
jgi:outer membrane protein TolC